MNTNKIIIDGSHTTEVLNILSNEIKNENSLSSIKEKAAQIIKFSVDPVAGPPKEPSDGLLYGLIQSGKTSVITVSGAMAIDNGFQFVLLLTSNYDPLYQQTLERARQVWRGIRVLGKNDWKDPIRFQRQIRTTPFAIVCSKGVSMLDSMLDSFKKAGARGLSTFIIDDEADQASLNTKASKGIGDLSRTNEIITEFRKFFPVNTYLQVTATPQSLFLQRPGHPYRPSFTVLSEPGHGYIGGEAFFGDNSELLSMVDLEEVEKLHSTHQPSPSGIIPDGLKSSLYTFLVSATVAALNDAGEIGFSYLCHISHTKIKHEYVVNLIDRFKEETINNLDSKNKNYEKTIKEFKTAYEELLKTNNIEMPDFGLVMRKINFYLPGASIKLINAGSNDEVKVDCVYNIFVGGNKLGRGVTIKNLLVSYYGRNPKVPNSDTVLQHARMYGYRKKYLGLTRLYLPEKLAYHFILIHQMEKALRELVERHPTGNFEGIFISSPLRATRSNVIEPNSIGLYAAGSSVNPKYPLRTMEAKESTDIIDKLLSVFGDDEEYHIVDIDFLIKLIKIYKHDESYGSEMWDKKTIVTALEKIKSLYGKKAYLRVKRDRNLNMPRGERQGILSGGEALLVSNDAPVLFMYRNNKSGKNMEAWWPQLRFTDGNYVLAFSFNR